MPMSSFGQGLTSNAAPMGVVTVWGCMAYPGRGAYDSGSGRASGKRAGPVKERMPDTTITTSKI
jgi:hypothetical protein